jgi:hypothetical protein
MLLYLEYRIPYATPPSDYDVAEAFTWKLYDASDTYLVGYNTAYPYHERGWNWGIVSFYFYAANNPGWGDAYKIHLVSNEGVFAAPLDYAFDFITTDYSTDDDGQAYQRSELRDKVIRITQDLEDRWDMTLLDVADVGTILSLRGELYFRAAIPQLQEICPNLFYFQVDDPKYGPRIYSTTYVNSIEEQWGDSAVGIGIQASGDLFGVDPMVVGALVVIVACIALVFIHVRKTASINSGLTDCYPVILVASLGGIFPLAIACFIDFLAWTYLGYILIFRR